MDNLKDLKIKIKELKAIKEEGNLLIYPSGMLQAYEECYDLVKKLTIPATVGQSEQLKAFAHYLNNRLGKPMYSPDSHVNNYLESP